MPIIPNPESPLPPGPQLWKTCPLRAAAGRTNTVCEQARCAWWSDGQMCAIPAIVDLIPTLIELLKSEPVRLSIMGSPVHVSIEEAET